MDTEELKATLKCRQRGGTDGIGGRRGLRLKNNRLLLNSRELWSSQTSLLFGSN
jgi:hypothetical protein